MIKSNSDHVLRVDSATIKLATMVMANSSGSLILSACKRNSLCTCSDNENHSLNTIKSCHTSLSFNEESEYDSKLNCAEHQTGESKKCKLNESSDTAKKTNMCSVGSGQSSNSGRNQSSSQQDSNQSNNDDEARYNQNNEIENQAQQNNDENNNDNNDQINVNLFQMANQMVDINNNIIEPEFMLVDENNNYIWDNNDNGNQQPRNEQNDQNIHLQPNRQQQQQPHQNPSQSSNNNERTSQRQNLSLLKDKLICSKSNCTSCKSISLTTNNQSIQIRQRKKLLELDLNKPRTSCQHYSPMNDLSEEENMIKRSASSSRRKKSLQCKKCLTTNHLSKCDHHHSISFDCPTPTAETINDSKKIHNTFKTKANTPITLCPVITTTPINEQLIVPIDSEVQQTASKSQEQTNSSSIISPQCPICLSMTINEPCRPNNCSHNFCQICVTEWAKVSNECPLCRNPFTALLNKNGLPLECSINLQTDRDLNFEFSQSSLENILNSDDLNWPIIASAFLNQTTNQLETNMTIDQQQCEQFNSILNSIIGHLEPQNVETIEWPF